jgi:hypothetical protein
MFVRRNDRPELPLRQPDPRFPLTRHPVLYYLFTCLTEIGLLAVLSRRS